MHFFVKVCKYQSLPVFIKYLLFAFRFKNKSAVPFGRLEQQVYFGIMPQRLSLIHIWYLELINSAIDAAGKDERIISYLEEIYDKTAKDTYFNEMCIRDRLSIFGYLCKY